MPSTNEKIHFAKIRSIFFFTLIVSLTLGFFYLVWPFAYPLFWAAVLAILFHPFYAWLNKHIKMPSITSAITILLILALVLVPLYYIVIIFIHESQYIFNGVQTQPIISNVAGATNWLNGTPLSQYADEFRTQWTSGVSNVLSSIGPFITDNLRDLAGNSLKFIFSIFVMFYALYYLFKDGPAFVNRLLHLSPLGSEYEARLVERFTSTTRATLKGTLIIGSIQGLIGGILFWSTGIQGALIWGVLMAIVSIIPGIGAWIVWLPIGVITLLLGHAAEGIIILAVGALIISLVDNLLRPILVGKDIQMHPLLVFLSTLGGIFLFGISGFVIGPIITALFMSVMNMYDYYYEKELKRN